MRLSIATQNIQSQDQKVQRFVLLVIGAAMAAVIAIPVMIHTL